MNPTEIVLEYFPDLTEDEIHNVLHLFATDMSVWGDGDTAEDKLRDSLDKAVKQYNGFKQIADTWIADTRRNLH
jgi:hypothetical protein